MLAKLVNGTLRRPDNIIYYEDVTVINPTEEELKELGYMEVEDTARPDPEDGFYFNSHYEVIDGVIKKVWEKIAIPEPVEPEPDIFTQIDNILMGKEEA